MREIKFRAWDREFEEMFYSDFVVEANSRVLWWTSGVGFATDRGVMIELMQYTGLKDKNGKEIYEGDLLKWNDSRIMRVEWGSVGWTLWSDLFKSFGHPDGNDCGEFHTKNYCGHSEIIGNIYQNPELLK